MRRFWKNLGIYCLLLSLMVGGGLFTLWRYLECYEASQPGPVVKQYEAAQMQSDYNTCLAEASKAMQTDFQSAEEIEAFLHSKLDPQPLQLRREGLRREEMESGYSLWAGSERLGKVKLIYEDQGFFSFGRQKCSHAVIEPSFEGLEGMQYTVTAPDGAQVYANGVLLNAENAAAQESLRQSSELTKGYEPPAQWQYSFLYYGKPEITVEPDDTFNYHLEAVGESYVFTETCRWETSDAFVNLCEGFIRAYVAYGCKAGSYGAVLQYLIPETELYERIVSSIHGAHWANGVKPGIRNYSVETIYPYGSVVICDTHYSLDYTNGSCYHANMRLMLTRTLDGWKIRNIEMY